MPLKRFSFFELRKELNKCKQVYNVPCTPAIYCSDCVPCHIAHTQTEQVGISGVVSYLYSGGARFEFRPEHRLS
jgi:hypothetical protein